MHAHRRQLWQSLVVAVVAMAVLTLCWTLPSLIPATWRSAGKGVRDSTYVPYIAPDGQLIYLVVEFKLLPVGNPLETETTLQLNVLDRPQNFPAQAGVTADRAEAMAELQALFSTLCRTHGYPDAAREFATAQTAPGYTVAIRYPDRARIAFLLRAQTFVVAAAWLVLAASLALVGLGIYRVRAARRALADRTCRRCGYDLAGLPAGAPCPECSLDNAAARAAAARRAGRSRRLAGSVVLAVGCVVFIAGLSGGAPVRLLDHKGATQLDGWRAEFAGGAVRLVTYDYSRYITALSGSAAGSLIDPEESLGAIDPSRWTPWQHRASLTSHRFVLALWALGALLIALGACLISVGVAARRDAATPRRSPARRRPLSLVARFILHLLALAAALSSIAVLPLLSPTTSEHFISLKRNKGGALIISVQPAEGGTSGTVTGTFRTSPVLTVDTTSTRWSPAAPSLEELRTTVNRAESDSFEQRHDVLHAVLRLALDSLTSPTGSVTSARLQSGLLVILACAALLVHPARLATAMLRRRRNAAPAQTSASPQT